MKNSRQYFPSSQEYNRCVCDNNSSNFTFVAHLENFNLHEAETVNVQSMNKADVHGVGNIIDVNEVQSDDTLEDYMDDEDVKYKSDDETSDNEGENMYSDCDHSDEQLYK